MSLVAVQVQTGAKGTASAPTYSEGNAVPLSTDLAGNLRVTPTPTVGATTAADNLANPSTGVQTIALASVYDGSTWDRLRGDSTGGAYVQGASADGAAVAGNPVRVAGKDGSGNTQDVLTDTSGNVGVQTAVPRTSGGYSTFHLASAASTNATSVKASAGQLYGYTLLNTNASIRYLAFHNTAGTPTAGSSVFFKMGIPALGGANVVFPAGVAFSTGIAITTITGAADNDSTGVAANDLIINLWYA